MYKKLKKNKTLRKCLQILTRFKPLVLGIIFLSIIIDIFFLLGSSDLRIFSILGVSILFIIIYSLKSRLIFIHCLVLLIIMFISSLATGTSEQTEKTAVWFVLFFAVGIIRQWRE